jgi:hypothetical protein
MSGSTRTKVIVKEDNPSFMRKSGELDKLLRLLKKHEQEAIKVLEVNLKSKDEKISQRAAEFLLDMIRSTAKDINTDEFNRLVAQVKMNGLGQPKTLTIQGQQQPVIDFDNVIEV